MDLKYESEKPQNLPAICSSTDFRFSKIFLRLATCSKNVLFHCRADDGFHQHKTNHCVSFSFPISSFLCLYIYNDHSPPSFLHTLGLYKKDQFSIYRLGNRVNPTLTSNDENFNTSLHTNSENMKRMSNKLTVSTSSLSTPASSAKFSEELLRELHHIQLMMSTKKMKDFNYIASTYPSACSVANFAKNGYQNVLPKGDTANSFYLTHILEETTRVKLGFIKGEEGSDYINANFITTSDKVGCSYICCQAPLPNTFQTFWRMICEQKVPVVCMLTRVVENSKHKADVYWPEQLHEVARYGMFSHRCTTDEIFKGNITVTLKAVSHSLQNIDVRTFEVNHNGVLHEVAHLHYTEWPDFGTSSGPSEF